MSPSEIRFLRIEVERVSPEVLTPWHAPHLIRALCESLKAIERLLSDSAGLECDVPEPTLELLQVHFEFLPGRLAPPLRGTIVYVDYKYGVIRSAGKTFCFRGREIVGSELSDELVGKKVEFDIKATSKGPRAINVHVAEQ